MSKQRIGVFSGTFDPVHRGHVESCVVALGALTLDTVLILIEKEPRRKAGVAELRDRANMLELATMDFPSLQLVDLETKNITTKDTLNYLHQRFPGSEYWYIVGSDMLGHMTEWPGHEQIFEAMHLCVVLRDNDELPTVKQHVTNLKDKHPDTQFVILPSVWSPVSSSKVKESLRNGVITTGVDPAVQEYIHKHQLYGVQ
jgi:nicotinate (nicotinamide) nucleotide adenylyltransferase